MKIEFNEKFTIPSATPQQRKLGGKNTHPTEGLRLARATWQALLEKHRPPYPFTKPVSLFVDLCYHHATKLGPKTTRPDGDNLLKIIKDAAAKAGWWKDDAIVFIEYIRRIYVRCEDYVVIIGSDEL